MWRARDDHARDGRRRARFVTPSAARSAASESDGDPAQ
ncbi:hypothetical protein DB32_004232 [Sandaracinus amylolyticus]|uniref:Uncharacterized protein n=1 Tax=Sandaracinus amylolyticus TaxID=927083 RepID=A0A0F6W4H8_9BACT|nr:hypothetical protein DB32_004232 [Sandaracinus amylolyticus]